MFVHREDIIKGQKFKLLFSNSTDVVECTYTLHESIIASNWFRKIKHLKDVPVDPVESYMTDLSDIKALYRQFCDYAQIPKDIDWTVLDQDVLNALHRVYESHHPTLVNLPNTAIRLLQLFLDTLLTTTAPPAASLCIVTRDFTHVFLLLLLFFSANQEHLELVVQLQDPPLLS